jgi:hypothetical protein
MTENIIIYRNVMFDENVFAFFQTTEDGTPLTPIIGTKIENVLLDKDYWYDIVDPNSDGSFPVYDKEDIYIGRIFCPTEN